MTMQRRALLKTGAAYGAIGALGWTAPLWAAAAATIKPGAKDALIVVDVQNCFVDGGTLPVEDGAKVVPLINLMAKSFENVVATQDWHTPRHASFASSHAGKQPFQTTTMPYGEQVLWPDHCVQGTNDAALVDSLDLPHAALIVRKGHHPGVDSYSAFEEADRKTPTGLGGYLRERGIERVFVSGLATDFCVAWTALDARARGLDTYVVEDATCAIDLNGSLADAWKRMADQGVKRIRAGEIAAA